MRNPLNLCRCLAALLLICLAPVPASASGFSDKFAEKVTKDHHAQEQIKNGFDLVEAEVESWASKGETTRGASGPIMQLLYGSDTLICGAWIISFRQELQRLIVSDYLDPPLNLIRGMQDLLSRVERACQGVLQPGMPAAVTAPAAAPAAEGRAAGRPALHAAAGLDPQRRDLRPQVLGRERRRAAGGLAQVRRRDCREERPGPPGGG